MKCFHRALLFLGLVAMLTGCSKRTDDIVIGAYFPLTGNTATWGEMGKKAVDIAVDELNASGGLLGKKIRMVYEDDQSLPEQAKIAVLKLIKQHKVAAIIGEFASSRTLAAAPEAQRHHIPMISPYSTNPKVTEVGDYIFRVCYIDPFQGGAMARFTVETLGLKRIAILKDIKNDYSVGLADFFTQTLTQLGGTVVAETAYSEGDVEFRSQLTQLKVGNPEAIYIPGYYTEVGLIARQARELGLTVPLMGGDGWDSPKTVEIGGDATNGTYFTASFAVDDPNPLGRELSKKFQDRFGHDPDGTAAVSYEAAIVLFDAIRRAGSTDGQAIRDALADTKNFEGVSGRFTLDANRNAIKRIVIMTIHDGALKFNSAVEPS